MPCCCNDVISGRGEDFHGPGFGGPRRCKELKSVAKWRELESTELNYPGICSICYLPAFFIAGGYCFLPAHPALLCTGWLSRHQRAFSQQLGTSLPCGVHCFPQLVDLSCTPHSTMLLVPIGTPPTLPFTPEWALASTTLSGSHQTVKKSSMVVPNPLRNQGLQLAAQIRSIES